MINYSDQGSGEAVLLIHGYMETSEIWHDFAGRLAERFRVITIDLPGHGRSGLSEITQTMELMAGEIRDLIQSLGTEKVFMTGHSLGGYVTLAFAELYPELLSGYCLFHSHPLGNTPENLVSRKNELAAIEAGKKDLIYPGNITRLYSNDNLEKFKAQVERSKRIASEISGDAIAAVLRGMILRPSRLHVMESGRIPCLWILGTRDNYINFTEVRKKVRLPVNAELSVLENSGHIGFIEEEERSLEVLAGFISRLIKQSEAGSNL